MTATPLDQRRSEGPVSGSDHLIRSAHRLMLNTVLGATLGLAFWFAAARLYTSYSVGRDSALIASMMSLSAFCTLNLQNTLLRFLPMRRERPGRAVLSAYGIAALATTLGAVALVLIMPAVSDEFTMFRTRPEIAILYVVGAVVWTVFALQDAALTAMRRASWVPIKNTTYYVLKLVALLPLAAAGSVHGVFIAWVAPAIAMLLPVNLLMFRRALPAHARVPAQLGGAAGPSISRREFLRFSAQDSAAGALNLAALTLLPLLVVALLGSRANAYFFIPFTIVVTFDLLFLNVAASLVAEGARDTLGLPVLVRSIVRRFLPPLLVGVAVLLVAAPLILAPFGAEYAREGTAVLRLMALASVFRAMLAVFIAVSRIRRHGVALLRAQLTFSALLMALILVLSDRVGLEGIALAWLCAAAVVGLTVAPSLVRYVRTPPAGPSGAAQTGVETGAP